MKYLAYILFLIPLFFAITSCDGGDECRENLDVKMYSKFYSVEYNETSDEYRIVDFTIPLYIRGIGSNYLLYNKENISSFQCYLKDFESETQFEIQDTFFIKDTITVIYKNIEEFISLECGSIVLKDIEDVSITTNLLDSVIVKQTEVNQLKNTHLYFYFKNKK